jgi:hypothetical protein
MHGNDVYAFNGHDTGINFAYSHRLAGGAWSAEEKLTTVSADGSANVRWDLLHETNPSIIDSAFYGEDRLHDRSFLGEIYYRAIAPSTATTPAAPADPTPPPVSKAPGVATTAAPDAGPSPLSILFGSTALFPAVDNNIPGNLEAFRVDPAASGSLSRLHVFLDAPLPSSLLVGLYDDADGAPGTLLATTTPENLAAGWNDLGFGPVALRGASPYWVALLVPSGGSGTVNFRIAKTGPAMFVGGRELSALPATWPADGTSRTDGPLAAYGG